MYFCRGTITSVTLTEGITKLGNGTFFGLENVPTVTIPSTVASSGEVVFRGWASLEQFCVDPANTHFSDYGGALIGLDDHILHYYPRANPATSFAVP